MSDYLTAPADSGAITLTLGWKINPPDPKHELRIHMTVYLVLFFAIFIIAAIVAAKEKKRHDGSCGNDTGFGGDDAGGD